MTEPINLDEATDDAHGMVLSALPPDFLDLTSIQGCRDRLEVVFGANDPPPMPDNVEVSEASVPGFGDDPDVRVKFYRPTDLPSDSPALVWIHGGGMVLMNADADDYLCATRAAAHNCLVASVDYRLAPETPAPGPVNDCYSAFRYVAENASELGIAANRIVLGGQSAGGGLAAGTSIMARDEGGPMPTAQLLICPMLDHRHETPSSYLIDDMRVWNRQANQIAWQAYLGGEAATAYSSPSICDELSGLPPAYINVGTLELFHDEDVAYATALNRAGVSCELHVYPGAFHGSFTFVADHPLSKRWQADQEDFLARALAGEV